MVREHFDMTRNLEAEQIQFLWKEYSRLMKELSTESNAGRHGILLERLDDLYNNKINEAYNAYYTMHGEQYFGQPELPHLA